MSRLMRLASLAAGLASTACSSPDDASGDMHLVLVQAPETATPGSPVAQSIIAKVVNGDGTAAPGVPVRWTIRSGGGRLQAGADTSGVDGLAAARWTPGLEAGAQEIGAYLYDQPALTIRVNAEAFLADKIVTAYRSGCGLQGEAVYCWEYPGPTGITRRILPDLHVRDLALSWSYLCVVDQAGSVYCQRAFGDPGIEPSGTVQGLPPIKAISGGIAGRFCALAQADGTAWCWSRQALVATQRSVVSFDHISGDDGRGCGLTSSGTAWCWSYGPSSPAPIAGGLVFRAISAGNSSVCAISPPAALYCWYYEDPEPRRFTGIEASQVSLGGSTGVVNGSFGAQEFSFWSIDPPLHDLHSAFPLPVVQVSSQDDTPCVVATDRAVYCLGVNDNIEQLYHTTWEAVPAPQP